MDRTMSKSSVATTSTPAMNHDSLYNVFFTSPVRAEHNFSNNVPHRKISCEEVMYESKLSMIIPNEMVRMFRYRCLDLKDELSDALTSVRNPEMQEALRLVLRNLNSNVKTYMQMIRFMDSYKGSSFRPSREKFRIAFSAVPINLHVQSFHISGEPSLHAITCGAIAAIPLRFQNGGLCILRESLSSTLEGYEENHTLETTFYQRRSSLLNAKKEVADLTCRIRNNWKSERIGILRKMALQFNYELKQLHRTVTDFIKSFPNISDLVDALSAGGSASLPNTPIKGTLSSQVDTLDAAMTKLNSAIIIDDQTSRESFENNVKSSLNSVLDSLHHLVDSLLMAQLLGLVIALRKPSNAEAYFQIQLRSDIVLSQAVTLVTTCLLTNIEHSTKEELTSWVKHGPFVSFYGFISAYRTEKGMIEDMRDIWSIFHGHVRFSFTLLNPKSPKSTVPQIVGIPGALNVTIPLTAEAFAKLPEPLTRGEWIRVRTFYWNTGLNHEVAMGDTSLEDTVNMTALSSVTDFVNSAPVPCGQLVKNALTDLNKTMDKYRPGEKTVIFPKVQALTRALNGVNVLSCQSGKDRTSMALTLEEGNALRTKFEIPQRQAEEIIDSLRRDGVRLENCRKNIGRPAYSCSPIQLRAMPVEFRPPSGTYDRDIAR